MGITLVEALLVIGTFGICTGVWVTLAVIMAQHKIQNPKQSVRVVSGSIKLKENG